MSGCIFSKLRVPLLVTGCASLVLSMFPSLFEGYSAILRPLLNLSWGCLLGGLLIVTRIQNASYEKKNIPSKYTEVIVTSLKTPIFGFATLASSVLLISTVGLAPDDHLLHWGAAVSLVGNMLNVFLICPEEAKLMGLKHSLEDAASGDSLDAKKSLMGGEENSKTSTPQEVEGWAKVDKDGNHVPSLSWYTAEFKRYRKYSRFATYMSLFGLLPYSIS